MIETGDAPNLQQNPQPADGNRQTECNVCLRKMRSDNTKRHLLKHQELHTLDEEEIRDEIKRRKKLRETREEREQLVRQIADEEGLPHEYCDIETPDTEEDPPPIEEELLKDDQPYTRKLERRRTICKILEQGSVPEDSRSRRTAGKRSKSTERIRQCVTYPMQNYVYGSNNCWIIYLLHLMHREVIWVWGQTGDEGKTWFQGYLETLYGYARVVRLDLKIKTGNVLHVLTEQPLST